MKNAAVFGAKLNEFIFIVLVCCFLHLCRSDVYLHNPRGSNNRYNENTRPRKNNKRLFDSQNNERGGYNVGNLYYHSGSQLMIEWTNQHSCGNENSHCELVLQYMCDSHVRDGVLTQTIPELMNSCSKGDCDSDSRFGMHENSAYYRNCRVRERNKGLFLADQVIRSGRDRAIYTRQDNKGTRYGLECPEERDYYPYWHPTPWRDIAVLTNDVRRCAYYMENSENVEGRGYCYVPEATLLDMRKSNGKLPNNAQDCEDFYWPRAEVAGAVRGEWRQAPSHGIAAPECRETEYSRDNHLGNGVGGYPNTYNWTLPHLDEAKCVLRLRYNISTADYDGWNTSAADSPRPASAEGLTDSELLARGYRLKNRPHVQAFDDAPGVKLELNINTDQYGRTFQDRSHVFSIIPRPAALQDANVYNLNVRGKRGNIVQVYPAVEYDYVPNTLQLAERDVLHIQWTGSNTNPLNNDGEGRAGTDRSNLLLQAPVPYDTEPPSNTISHWGRSYPVHLVNASLLGLSFRDRDALATLSNVQRGGDMRLLDEAGTYFDLGPRRITSVGTYHVMCSRNNNFSNRSQKGRLHVLPYPSTSAALGWSGGALQLKEGEARVHVPPAALSGLHKLRLELWPKAHGEERIRGARGNVEIPGSGYASDFLVLHPEGRIVNGKLLEFKLKLLENAGSKVSVYRANSNGFGTWTRLDAHVSGGVATFRADGGGVYVVRSGNNIALIAGLVVGLLVLVLLVLGTVLFCRRHPAHKDKLNRKYKAFKHRLCATNN